MEVCWKCTLRVHARPRGFTLHPHKIPRRCTGTREGEKLRITGLGLPVRELCSDSIFLSVFDFGPFVLKPQTPHLRSGVYITTSHGYFEDGIKLWLNTNVSLPTPLYMVVVLVQSLIVSDSLRLCATLRTAARQASLSFTVSWSLLKLVSIELVMPFNHLILCIYMVPVFIRKACMRAKSLHSCPTLCSPIDVACQVPLCKGFFRQEYWSESPCPPPGDLANPGIEPTSRTSPALAGRFFTTSATWGTPEGAYNKWKMGGGTSMDFAIRTWEIGLVVK